MNTLTFIAVQHRVCKTYKEHNNCKECPIDIARIESEEHDLNCSEYLAFHPVKCIQVYEEWAKSNPITSKCDWFTSMFPDKPWRNYVIESNCFSQRGYKSTDGRCSKLLPCADCSWWNTEYIERER